MSTLAAIGLGSNLGDRRALLESAVAALSVTPGLSLESVSSFEPTAPVGGPEGQGEFLNAAVVLESELDAPALHRRLRELETEAGRVRHVRWGERTLDLDLLLFGDQVHCSAELTLPHPRMPVRRFVLAPLAEIAPELVDPMTGRTILDLLAHLDRRPSYLALDGNDPQLTSAVFRELTTALRAEPLAADALEVPSWPVAHSPAADLQRGLETKALALDPAEWPADRLAGRWLVSDFCLDLDERRRLQASLNGTLDEPAPGTRSSREQADRQRETYYSIRGALSPTFAVILGRPPSLRRAARQADFPLLWIDSTDPAAICEEILAACAATRIG